MAVFQAMYVENGIATNSHGYRQEFPNGLEWSVRVGGGDLCRVHNGFPMFASLAEADWCAELMNGAYLMGMSAARAEVRAALGIEDSEADNG